MQRCGGALVVAAVARHQQAGAREGADPLRSFFLSPAHHGALGGHSGTSLHQRRPVVLLEEAAGDDPGWRG